MSTATTTAPKSTTPTVTITAKRLPTWRSGLVTGMLGAAAASLVAILFGAAGQPLTVGTPIPVLGFAQVVLLATIAGIVLARRLRRTTFIRVATVLTALSCIPSAAMGTGIVSQIGLVLVQLLVAAIVIPRLAR